MGAIIGFVSDFGLDDTWVGVCHAVIHSRCPDAHVVDLAHGIEPYNVRKGASVAAAGAYQLPGAIHLIAIDPGVGGPRRDVCLVAKHGTRLVGPDNGVLLPAAERCGGVTEAYCIAEALPDEGKPLPTFHARDVLAPAAASLASGVAPDRLGERIDILTLVPAPFAQCRRDGDYVVGEVLDADRFGSLRINVPTESMEALGLVGDTLVVEIGHNSLTVPFGQTFSDVNEGEPVLLVDSSGWLTLAINQGNALDRYGVSPGTHTRIRMV